MAGDPTTAATDTGLAGDAAQMRDMFVLFQNALNGNLTGADIPEGFVDNITSFMSALVGQEQVQEYLNANFPSVKTAIIDRITDPSVAPENNPLIQILQGKTVEELATFIEANPEIQAVVAEHLAPSIAAQAQEAIANTTVAQALERANIPATDLPAALLETKLTEVTAQGLEGVSDAALRSIIINLPMSDDPATGFNAVLATLNETLVNAGAEPIAPLAADATVEDRAAAFDGALSALVEANDTGWANTGLWFRNLFNSSAEGVTIEALVHEAVFDGIRESAPATLRTMAEGAVPDVATMSPTELAQSIKSLEPAALARILQTDEARRGLESAITLDFLNRNVDEFMPYAIDMMQGGILDTVANALSSLSANFPDLAELFQGLFGMIGQFLESVGLGNLLNTNTPAPAATPAAPETETAPEEHAAASPPAMALGGR